MDVKTFTEVVPWQEGMGMIFASHFQFNFVSSRLRAWIHSRVFIFIFLNKKTAEIIKKNTTFDKIFTLSF